MNKIVSACIRRVVDELTFLGSRFSLAVVLQDRSCFVVKGISCCAFEASRYVWSRSFVFFMFFFVVLLHLNHIPHNHGSSQQKVGSHKQFQAQLGRYIHVRNAFAIAVFFAVVEVFDDLLQHDTADGIEVADSCAGFREIACIPC